MCAQDSGQGDVGNNFDDQTTPNYSQFPGLQGWMKNSCAET